MKKILTTPIKDEDLEALNIGDTTAVYLIVEPKAAAGE